MENGRIDIDRIGMVAGGLCAVHCVLSGLFLGLLSTIGATFVASATTEVVFIAITAVIGAWACFTGFRRHRLIWPAFVFGAGILMISLAHTFHAHRVGESNPLSATIFAVSGALCLVAFHVANLRAPSR